MMKYIVKIQWSGYSRGSDVYEVEADSEAEAKSMFYMGKRLSHVIVRDDREVDHDETRIMKRT